MVYLVAEVLVALVLGAWVFRRVDDRIAVETDGADSSDRLKPVTALRPRRRLPLKPRSDPAVVDPRLVALRAPGGQAGHLAVRPSGGSSDGHRAAP